jgi:predicted ATPase/DNA-binding SARP family transcriptional activator
MRRVSARKCFGPEEGTLLMTVQEASAAPLVITLFGPIQVLVDGQPLPRLRSRKGIWLLALLTLRHDRPVEREWLAGTLWPDMDQSQAFANLRPVLSELRGGLGDQKDRLQSPDRHTLVLDLAGAEVDLLRFDAALRSGKIADLEQAVALYRAPLLEGCQEEWVPQERAIREQECLQALYTLGAAALTAGNYGGAIGYYQKAASLDPFSDIARHGWMEALRSSGDSNTAMQVYRDFAGFLRAEMNAVPDEKTRALYQDLRTESRRRAAEPTVAAAKPEVVPKVTGYLPHALTDLVGREDERLEVAALLRRSRLVTLVGPGGIGKTRLAIEVAAEAAPEFTDGVWLVALDSLSDGNRIAGQVAAVLGLKEEPARPALEYLADHLRAKRLLLVMDNCEHLLEASAQVAGYLLARCAGLRVLTTSREALGVLGEEVWTVPPLAVPDPAHLPARPSALRRALWGYDSIQLFVERAQLVDKTFELTPGNAEAVARLSAQLHGMPLAIELAAARVTALTVEQIASRLENSLGLLTMGNRAAAPRQQTLRATLDWSYKLLSPEEQTLLAHLSVFVGGWNLEAAEAICQGEEMLAEQVADLLTSLKNKSLVVFEQRSPDARGGRYRLQEMVRQYAAERLQTAGGTEQARARHRDFFLALAEAAEPNLKSHDQLYWLQRLEADIDNLRTALAWCGVEPGGAGAGLQLAAALWQFWELRGYFSEGRTSLAKALERDKARERTGRRARVLFATGVFAFYLGDYEAVRTQCSEALPIFRELGDKQGIAWALKDLGRVAGAQGEYETARAYYEESLAISREAGDLQGSSWLLNDLGNLASAQGRRDTARAFHAQSLEISRSLADTEGIAWALHHLGGIALHQEDYEAAQRFHAESLAKFMELENKQGVAWALYYQGNVAAAQRNYEEAALRLEEALEIFRELGNKQGMVWTMHDMAKMAAELGDNRKAMALHRESVGLQRDLGDKRGVAAGLRGLFSLLPPTDRRAAVLWGAAEALRESIGVPLLPREQEFFDQKVELLRVALGEHQFAAAREEGGALTLEQAAAYALEETKTQTNTTGMANRDTAPANAQRGRGLP